jgi:hypothetical protein
MDLTPRDLGAFAEAVSVGETARDGFGLGDIAMIPAAWEIVDGGARSFGWVVELRRGGRRYLRYRIGSAAKPDVTVTRLADGQMPRPRNVRWFMPDAVNLALRQHQAQLATLLNNLP